MIGVIFICMVLCHLSTYLFFGRWPVTFKCNWSSLMLLEVSFYSFWFIPFQILVRDSEIKSEDAPRAVRSPTATERESELWKLRKTREVPSLHGRSRYTYEVKRKKTLLPRWGLTSDYGRTKWKPQSCLKRRTTMATRWIRRQPECSHCKK